MTPWTVARQASLSLGFSRQEYWSGLPFPSPEDVPDPGFEPGSPVLQADSLPFELQGRPLKDRTTDNIIMNHFQTFEKFHGFLFKETHDVCCLHSLLPVCCGVCPLGDICRSPESFLSVTTCVVG